MIYGAAWGALRGGIWWLIEPTGRSGCPAHCPLASGGRGTPLPSALFGPSAAHLPATRTSICHRPSPSPGSSRPRFLLCSDTQSWICASTSPIDTIPTDRNSSHHGVSGTIQHRLLALSSAKGQGTPSDPRTLSMLCLFSLEAGRIQTSHDQKLTVIVRRGQAIMSTLLHLRQGMPWLYRPVPLPPRPDCLQLLPRKTERAPHAVKS